MNTHQKANTATGSAQEGATVRYTAKAHTSGGRRGGVSSSDDGRLDVKFSAPGLRPVSSVRWALWPEG
jgi:organic hydroperoxide reductase OsmC/OhrA